MRNPPIKTDIVRIWGFGTIYGSFVAKLIPPSNSSKITDSKLMATATMATAAGAAALLYYTLNRKLQTQEAIDEDDEENGSDMPAEPPLAIDRVTHRLIQAPGTWLETISTLSETLRFTYSETLGKWPIGDLAFGISFLLKRQGNYHVDSVFCGEDSVQLKGSEITAELKYLLNLLTLCWHFSKKPFPIFLEETGYTEENVLLREPKAGILKPAFTVIADHEMRCFLLLIRGTHSIKDTLTAVTGNVAPFHHTVVHQGGVSDLVLGYAHCGMVAAARWIAKLSTPCLLEGLAHYPDYKVKIVGHSLGGGTAAIVTYVLRETKELSVATCVTFAPVQGYFGSIQEHFGTNTGLRSKSLEPDILLLLQLLLAESGHSFITSIINGADLVPTFSASSVDDLRTEVTASAWINDLRNQIEQTRILSTVYRSASALGSRLPSIATARAKVAGAGAILQPVSNGTQVVMKRAKSMAQAAWTRPNLNLSSWSCMGPRRRAMSFHANSKDGGSSPSSSASTSAERSEPLLGSPKKAINAKNMNLPVSSSIDEWSSEIECGNESSSDAEVDVDHDDGDNNRYEDQVSEVELWHQLEHELYDGPEGEETDVVKEIREEEAAIADEVGQTQSTAPDMKEVHRFFPPGKIMHIVTLQSDAAENESDDSPTSASSDSSEHNETKIGIFLTSRSLYSKLRLSQRMISDHFMPVYRRQIERLIKELEEESAEGHNTQEFLIIIIQFGGMVGVGPRSFQDIDLVLSVTPLFI
ncbi:Sn1-specific diacylglycerol lipase alpha, partial [Mucuna pruriens]